MIRNLSQLIEIAKKTPKKRVAIAASEDIHVLKAVKRAVEENIIEPLFIGDTKKISATADAIHFNLSNIEVIDTADGELTPSERAVFEISKQRADILMKGAVTTAELLRAVLNKKTGLRKSEVLSHVAFFQSPYYHKLLCVTDVAMNIAPDLETKVHILNNAVEACSNIGIAMPKVAVAAAVETVNPKMEATLHADLLKKMNQDGKIINCIVDGPLAIDLAVSKQAALGKGIESEVAGDCDIILAPDIEAGNMFYKALNFLGGAQSAAVIMGATVPVVLTSRSDDENSKFYSLVLAAAMNKSK